MVGKPKFSPAKTLLCDCPGPKVKPTTESERKLGYISEDRIVLAFGLSARGIEGTVCAPAHF